MIRGRSRGRTGGRAGSRTGGRTERGDRGDDRRDSRDSRGERNGGRDRSRLFRKKVCRFCTDRVSYVDYKDSELLKRFLTEKGKVMPRRITGSCSKHQRILARAIKLSRHSGLVAFQTE